jgi:hydrogenase-1 operon protein HyaF
MTKLILPVINANPAMPPEEEEGLDYMPMPSEMQTYRAPILPEPETLKGVGAAKAVLDQLLSVVSSYQVGDIPTPIDMMQLDSKNRDLVQQVLGEGEVQARYQGMEAEYRIQESVFAGVWQLQQFDLHGQLQQAEIEVSEFPQRFVEIVAPTGEIGLKLDAAMPEGLMNAPSILTEIVAKQAEYEIGMPAHVINLTLLPITPEDKKYMIETLGGGDAVILSKGYGNCRITSTRLRHLWWVQYFNTMDTLILNTLEIIDIPQVAKAAAEDIADSAKRLQDLRQDYLQWV